MRALLVCAVAAALLAVPTLADLPNPNPPPAPEWVQPGAAVFNMRTTDHLAAAHRGSCTLNYVFESNPNGTVYIGSAGHCFDSDPPYGRPVGYQVYRLDDSILGTIRYRANQADPFMDFLLIEVASEQLANVRPWVYGHADAPVGYAMPGEVELGDLARVVGLIGSSSVSGSPAHDDREGIVLGQETDTYCVQVASFKGDSGGPVYHSTSRLAMGIVHGLTAEGCVSNPGGPTVDAIVRWMFDIGYDLTMRPVIP